MSSSIRVVKMAAVVDSGEPESASSDVAASYRLRTSREHNDAEMLAEEVHYVRKKSPTFKIWWMGSYRPADRCCENALECGLSLRNPIRWDPVDKRCDAGVMNHSPERAVSEDKRQLEKRYHHFFGGELEK